MVSFSILRPFAGPDGLFRKWQDHITEPHPHAAARQEARRHRERVRRGRHRRRFTEKEHADAGRRRDHRNDERVLIAASWGLSEIIRHRRDSCPSHDDVGGFFFHFEAILDGNAPRRCICCTVRQDLVVVLDKLAKRVQAGTLKLDGIVIETTGMADPAPVAQTFFVEPKVAAFARLDGIITLVDAKHIIQHLDEEKPEGAENEAVEQVAFADRILLNKIDLATEGELQAVEQRLKGINAFAPIIRSEKSQVSVDQVLGIKAFDLKKTLEMDPEFLDTEGEHEHDDSVTSMSITTSGEVHMLLVNDWVGDVLKNLGNDIYRMKGVLAVAGSPKKFVYQAVHMIFDGVFEGEWGPSEERGNKLVFIGKNLDKAALQRGFEACLDTPQNRAKIEEAEMIKVRDAASRRVVVSSLHWHESSPGEEVVGGLFFDFEAVRTESSR